MKRIFGVIGFILLTGLVIAMGIRSGMSHEHCRECSCANEK